jgi:hypothetical protein
MRAARPLLPRWHWAAAPPVRTNPARSCLRTALRRSSFPAAPRAPSCWPPSALPKPSVRQRHGSLAVRIRAGAGRHTELVLLLDRAGVVQKMRRRAPYPHRPATLKPICQYSPPAPNRCTVEHHYFLERCDARDGEGHARPGGSHGHAAAAGANKPVQQLSPVEQQIVAEITPTRRRPWNCSAKRPHQQRHAEPAGRARRRQAVPRAVRPARLPDPLDRAAARDAARRPPAGRTAAPGRHRGKRLLLLGHLDTVFEPGNTTPAWEAARGRRQRQPQGPGRVRHEGRRRHHRRSPARAASAWARSTARASPSCSPATKKKPATRKASRAATWSNVAKRSDVALSFEGSITARTAGGGHRRPPRDRLLRTGNQGAPGPLDGRVRRRAATAPCTRRRASSTPSASRWWNPA